MELTDIFSNYGFPVAMVIVMCLYIWKTQKQHKEEMQMLREEQRSELKDIREEHKAEVKELTKAVNKQSELITELILIARANVGGGQSNVSDSAGISEKG